jgi:hypothetical protein
MAKKTKKTKKTKKITVVYEGYPFAELDEHAKDRVRSWYAEGMYDWDEFVKEDFAEIANILGVIVKNIYYSGFWSQGDGAMFEGTYYYAKGSAKKIREYAPEDTALHEIADTLAALQKPYFYGLSATVTHYGRYYHSLSNIIEVECDDPYRDIDRGTEDGIKEALRDLMHWLYRSLENEYEFQTSDEVIADSCEANEWYFTEYGKLI